MDRFAVILMVEVFLALALALASAIISALRIERHVWERAQRARGTTLVLIVLTGGIGGAYYWVRIRPQLREAKRRADEFGRSTPAARARAIGRPALAIRIAAVIGLMVLGGAGVSMLVSTNTPRASVGGTRPTARLPDGLVVTVTSSQPPLDPGSVIPAGLHPVLVTVTFTNQSPDSEIDLAGLSSGLSDTSGQAYDGGRLQSDTGATRRLAGDTPVIYGRGEFQIADGLRQSVLSPGETLDIADIFLVDDTAPGPLQFQLFRGLDPVQSSPLQG